VIIGETGECGRGINREPEMSNNTTDEVSAKAIKTNVGILIENGIFNIDSSDDSIHSNGNVIINNGTFEIKSGDDGIHSDTSLSINNGEINISKSYEGVESAKIEINGGDINIVASDDGINVAGGNDSSSINGRPGQNNFSSNTDQLLTINSGTITIDATGDGIDINGNGYINGGKTIVNGPTNSGNGALDYAGTFDVSGGELIAIGASGMMQTPSKDSTIYSISYVFSTTQQSNTNIIIKNSSNEEVISVVATKSFNSVVASSEKFIKGESYTVYLNDEKTGEITLDNIVTSVGGTGMQMPGGGMMNGNPMDKGQMQGGKPDRGMMH